MIWRAIRKYRIGLLIIFFFNSYIPSLSSATVRINKSFSELSPGHILEYLEDMTGTLTLDDVRNKKYESKWYNSKKTNPDFGITSSAYWIRFQILNTSNQKINLFLEHSNPHIDSIKFYIIGKNGIHKTFETGDHKPFNERPYLNRNFTFPLSLNPETRLQCYIRQKTSSSMNFQITLRSVVNFKQNSSAQYRLLMLFYGIILVMIIYNILIYFFVKRIEYLYYVFSILFFNIFIMCQNGTAFEYFWPDFPWWANFCTLVFFCLMIIFSNAFTIKFLNIKLHSRFLYRSTFALIYLSIVILLLYTILNYSIVIQFSAILAGITSINAILAGIIFSLKKHRPAYFYATATIILSMSALIYYFRTLEILSGSFFISWSLHIGTIVMVIIFSIALGDSINILRKELQVLTHNLEDKVTERTARLKETLDQLNEKIETMQWDLMVASTVQKGILPKIPDNWNGIKISVSYKLVDHVGGDYYDVIFTGPESMTVLVADISGHGIPASLIAMMAKVLFRKISSKSISIPDIFRYVNHGILRSLKNVDHYMTCFMISIDIDHHVKYSNAAHQKALYFNSVENTIDELDTGGLFIGAMDHADSTYEEKSIQMCHSDRIVIFTDGIIELKNEKNEEFGTDRLKKIIIEGKTLEIDLLKEKILQDIDNFKGPENYTDDMTLIIIESEKSHDNILEFLNIGKKHFIKGDTELALKNFRKYLSAYPDDTKLLLQSGKLAFDLGKFNEAKEYYSKYLAKNNNNADAHYNLAVILFRQKKYPECINQLGIALKTRKEFPEAQKLLNICKKK